MVGVNTARWFTVAFSIAAIALAVYTGAQLRLKDPMSSTVLPAEDTFTHMAYVDDHVGDGKLDPYNPGGKLYPPGTHTLLAAIWVYTGVDLYELMRFAPVLFGLVGIIGAAALVWRYEGPVGGIVAGFGMAVGQEIIRRTTMMAPTAVDVALLPFAFLAVLETIRGRMAWAPAAAAFMFFFVFSHPWLVTIIGMATGIFVVIGFAAPWARSRTAPITALGVAVVVSIVGIAWAASLSGCNGLCGPGFAEVIPNGERLNALAPFIALVAIGLATVVFLARRKLDELFQPLGDTPSMAARIVASLAIAGALIFITAPAVARGFPQYVDPVHMFGWPVIVLAAMGVVLLPFVRGPASYFGASMILVTYPFTIYNPFDSPFWSHRTAIYFGVGAVIMAGVAAAAIGRLVAQNVELQLANNARYRNSKTVPVYAALAMLLIASCMGGIVVASAPSSNHTSWYRLYSECEMESFQRLADDVEGTNAIVIMGTWQALLVFNALADPSATIWFKGGFYSEQRHRDDAVKTAREGGRPVLVIWDRHLTKEIPHQNAGLILEADPWEKYVNDCTGTPGTSFIVYNVKGARP